MPKSLKSLYRKQVGALPLRIRGSSLQVLLVTSRETGKWVIPKGWPMKGKKDHKAALTEAMEEVGVSGRIRKTAVGSYRYWKRLQARFELCQVTVFPLRVEDEHETWKEKGQRQRRWLGALEAADLALEPELSTLILQAVQDPDVLNFVSKA